MDFRHSNFPRVMTDYLAACQLLMNLDRILSGLNTGEDVQKLPRIIDFTRLSGFYSGDKYLHRLLQGFYELGMDCWDYRYAYITCQTAKFTYFLKFSWCAL